jgi:2,3-bisphosphoglycerate-dependent phosphoglycerate mutase
MQKKIYIIRHCEAQGQPSESQLTEKGSKQAKYLVDFFSHVKIDRIISLPDWYKKLKATFNDMELKFEGGESSQEAKSRIVNVVEEVLKRGNANNTVIVSHGNLISLLLKNYNSDFDFEGWKKLSNPDVFQINCINNEVILERIWDEDKVMKI